MVGSRVGRRRLAKWILQMLEGIVSSYTAGTATLGLGLGLELDLGLGLGLGFLGFWV
jgi:hypothetical protein